MAKTMPITLSVRDVPQTQKFIKAAERLAKAVRAYNECHVDVGPDCRAGWAKVIKAHDDLVVTALHLRLNTPDTAPVVLPAEGVKE